MQKHDRVVYISIPNGELVDLGKTLRQFRDDGTAYHEGGEMTGLLIYGDGHIFHCFECLQGNMDKLKQDLLNYQYHHSHNLIYEAYGVDPLFNTWEMIYAVSEPRIQDFMKKHGWRKFDPYLLNGEILDEFMQVVQSYSNVHKPAFVHPNVQYMGETRTTDHQKKVLELSYVLTVLTGIVLVAIAYFVLPYFGITIFQTSH